MLYVFDLIGTGVFAVAGALMAGRKRMDLFGVVVVACATALGGGTVRDLLLDRGPVFWMGDPVYLLTAAGAAVATFATAKVLRLRYQPVDRRHVAWHGHLARESHGHLGRARGYPRARRPWYAWARRPCHGFSTDSYAYLLVADAAGLAVFTVIGSRVAMEALSGPVIAVAMGMVTGVVGGMIRDVLCGEVPLILRREIYATASLAGAVCFVALAGQGVAEAVSLAVGAAVTLAVRLAAMRWHLRLPVFARTRGD